MHVETPANTNVHRYHRHDQRSISICIPPNFVMDVSFVSDIHSIAADVKQSTAKREN